MAGTDADQRRCTCPDQKIHAFVPRRSGGAAGPTTLIWMIAWLCLIDHPSSSAFVHTPSRYLGTSSAWRGPGATGREGMALQGFRPETRAAQRGGVSRIIAIAPLGGAGRSAEMSGMTELERARERLAAAKKRNLGSATPTAPPATFIEGINNFAPKNPPETPSPEAWRGEVTADDAEEEEAEEEEEEPEEAPTLSHLAAPPPAPTLSSLAETGALPASSAPASALPVAQSLDAAPAWQVMPSAPAPAQGPPDVESVEGLGGFSDVASSSFVEEEDVEREEEGQGAWPADALSSSGAEEEGEGEKAGFLVEGMGGEGVEDEEGEEKVVKGGWVSETPIREIIERLTALKARKALEDNSAPVPRPFSSYRINYLNGFRKSTPLKNRQLVVYHH